jgi:RNA polymerase sigma factor (sigma-70 family)
VGDPAEASGPDDGDERGASTERDLIVRARSGDHDAIARLYREHRPLAMQIANRLCRPADVDDVVAEAFTKVLDQIDRGAGPQVSFRAYLVSAVRSAAADIGRRNVRLDWSTDVEQAAAAGPTNAADLPGGDMLTESSVLAEAVSRLPSRWQLVVWWTVVERRSLAEVGDALGINANAAAALAFRAREGLRDAYLALHVPTTSDEPCARLRQSFPALLRSRLGAELTVEVQSHLTVCPACRDAYGELNGVREHGLSMV